MPYSTIIVDYSISENAVGNYRLRCVFNEVAIVTTSNEFCFVFKKILQQAKQFFAYFVYLKKTKRLVP